MLIWTAWPTDSWHRRRATMPSGVLSACATCVKACRTAADHGHCERLFSLAWKWESLTRCRLEREIEKGMQRNMQSLESWLKVHLIFGIVCICSGGMEVRNFCAVVPGIMGPWDQIRVKTSKLPLFACHTWLQLQPPQLHFLFVVTSNSILKSLRFCTAHILLQIAAAGEKGCSAEVLQKVRREMC